MTHNANLVLMLWHDQLDKFMVNLLEVGMGKFHEELIPELLRYVAFDVPWRIYL